MTDLVAVSEKDINNLKQIEQLGINLDFRILPRDKKQLFSDLLK